MHIGNRLAAVDLGSNSFRLEIGRIEHGSFIRTEYLKETVRGLLLYAWGWSVVATIALWAGIIALVFFALMLFATLGDFFADPRIAKQHIAS